MTNPLIAWTDGVGAASLVSQGRTFMNWTPDVHDVGDSQVIVGNGKTCFFPYRQDFLVSFDVAQIPQSDRALALRLKSWLVTGGAVTIATEDSESHVYTASLAPGTIPDFKLTDTTELEYTLSLVLVNASSAPFLYSPVLSLRGGTLTLAPGPLYFQLDSPLPQEVTATYLDALGAPIVGFTIEGVSNNESAFTISPSSGTTDSSGQVVFTVTPHVVGIGSVHAVAGARIASVACTVSVWEWDENFDQLDYAAFHAIYGSKWQWYSPVDSETYLSVAGGALLLTGDGTSTPTTNSINIGPDVISDDPAFQAISQFWAKIELTMTGGAFDGFGASDGGPLPLYFAIYGDGGEVDLNVDAANDGDPTTIGHFMVEFDGQDSSAISPLLAAGAHTFIVCLSNDGSLSKVELWIDATAGDAPNATNIGTYLVGKGPGDGVEQLYLQFAPPHSSGRVLEVHRCHFKGLPRAADPFSIL